MSTQPQKPGEKPHRPGPYQEVNPKRPPADPRVVIMPPGHTPLPPTPKPNEGWKPGPRRTAQPTDPRDPRLPGPPSRPGRPWVPSVPPELPPQRPVREVPPVRIPAPRPPFHDPQRYL